MKHRTRNSFLRLLALLAMNTSALVVSIYNLNSTHLFVWRAVCIVDAFLLGWTLSLWVEQTRVWWLRRKLLKKKQ